MFRANLLPLRKTSELFQRTLIKGDKALERSKVILI